MAARARSAGPTTATARSTSSSRTTPTRFAGVAPQGPLVAIGEKLLDPRRPLACRPVTIVATARLLYYAAGRERQAGRRFGGRRPWARCSSTAARPSTWAQRSISARSGDLLAFDDGVLYDHRSGDLRAFDLKSSQVELVDTIDRKGVKAKTAKWTIKELSEVGTLPSSPRSSRPARGCMARRAKKCWPSTCRWKTTRMQRSPGRSSIDRHARHSAGGR